MTSTISSEPDSGISTRQVIHMHPNDHQGSRMTTTPRRVQVMPLPGVTITLPQGIYPEQKRRALHSVIWYPAYRIESSFCLGVTHIVMGLLLIASNCAAIALNSHYSTIGHGMWGGVTVIITGTFGIAASRENTRKMILVHLCLAVLVTAMSIVGMILSMIGALHDEERKSDDKKSEDLARLAMNYVLASLYILEVGLALGSSVVSGIVCGPGESCTNCSCDEFLGETTDISLYQQRQLVHLESYDDEVTSPNKHEPRSSEPDRDGAPAMPVVNGSTDPPGVDFGSSRVADVGYARTGVCRHAYRDGPNKVMYCVFCGARYAKPRKQPETGTWRY